MANEKISAFTAASALTGSEELGGVQSAANAKITPAQIKTFCNEQVQNTGFGEIYPTFSPGIFNVTNGGIQAGSAMAASGEKRAVMGYLFIAGRAASKTISAAGSGKIHMRAGTTTFANAGTSVDIGIQGLSTSAGPVARPDDTFTVKKTLVGGTDTISSAAWNTFTMGSGSATLNFGDPIAVVMDMTSRGGADSVTFASCTPGQIGALPALQVYTAAAWASSVTTGIPIVIIEFDDGTLGTIYMSIPCLNFADETFNNASNPDERGNVFQVQQTCKIDGYWIYGGVTDSSSTFTVQLYTTPTGTPASVSGSSLTVSPRRMGVAAASRGIFIPLPAEITLTKNTDYWLAVQATGSSNVRLGAFTWQSANYKFPIGGTTYSKGARLNSGGGAATVTTTTTYVMAVSISSKIA